MNEKLVSIVIPTYNCGKFISETIESILSQTYVNWEAIIIDDDSSDDTEEIIKKYSKKDHRIKYFKKTKNEGAALARNKGVELAEGEFIAFLDSDDTWERNKLKIQISMMEKTDATFTCTSYKKIDENSNDLNKYVTASVKMNYEDLLRKCPGNSTVVYNSSKIGKVFIDNLRKRNDYIMWLKIIKQVGEIHGIQKVLSSHRIREESISSNKSSLIKYHFYIYRNIEKLSFFKTIYLCIYWVFVSLFKLRK